MVGMALGAFISVGLAKKFDKRNTVLIGGLVSVLANLMLGLLFVTGFVPHDATWIVATHTVPLALCRSFRLMPPTGLGMALCFPSPTP